MFPRRLYAHRGASAERPENTMPAFERAIECGVDALELDVHLTRDGQLLVAHDETAQRTCAAPLAWADLDVRDTQRLDAGWGFVARDGSRPFAGKGIAPPTLEQVLVAFPNMLLNVDLKDERAHAGRDLRPASSAAEGRRGSIDVMLELLRKHDAFDRVTLASFQLRTLVDVRRRGFSGQTALSQPEVASLWSTPAVLWRQLPFTGNAAQIPTKAGPLRFDRPAFIAKCHSLGLRVDYWVVDDVTEAARLLGLGADGIMTNNPAALRTLFV